MPRNFSYRGPDLVFPEYIGGGSTGYPSVEIRQAQEYAPRVKPVDLIGNPTWLNSYSWRYESGYVNIPGYPPHLNPWPIQMFGGANANPGSERAVMLRQECKDIAAVKLRMRLKDQTWNAAQTVAEFGKTLSFISSTTRDLMSAYKLARKGDLLGLSQWYHRYQTRGSRRFYGEGRVIPPLKEVGNKWLQWRYAVRPIAWDIQDALSYYYEGDFGELIYKLVSAKHKTGWAGISAEGVKYERPWWQSLSISVDGRYCVPVKTNVDAASWKRLGLVNVPALLWELTPGSFLLDWWFPVGQYLSGLDATFGLSFKPGTYAERIEISESFHWNGGVMKAESKSYFRQISGIPDQPVPRLRLSDYDLKNRSLDALALLYQVVSGRRGVDSGLFTHIRS